MLPPSLSSLRQGYYWIVGELGIDFRRLMRAALGVPAYLSDLIRYRAQYNGQISIRPCLADRYEQAGIAHGEYFLQDLHVARRIYERKPVRHVDVGSRIDGFVAHVASFREIDVLDIRPLISTVPGISFQQADLMSSDTIPRYTTDSISCLHALEHFGLGRYGDPLNSAGHEVGLRTISRMVAPGGTLYLSSPMGRNRVFFNSHRVMDPRMITTIASTCGLRLSRIDVITAEGRILERTVSTATIESIAASEYTLTIMEFVRDQ